MSNVYYLGEIPENMPEGTQALVATPDIKEVIAAAHTGDVNEVASAVETFTNRAVASMTNPLVLGPMALLYALKGKLSGFERGVLGLVGVAALYNFASKKAGDQKPWQQQFLTQSSPAIPSQASQETSSEILADGKTSTI